MVYILKVCISLNSDTASDFIDTFFEIVLDI